MNQEVLAGKLSSAIQQLYADAEPHSVPSPSGVRNCIRQQWFAGTNEPRTDTPPDSGIVKMEGGKGIEAYWRSVYKTAGFAVFPSTGRFDIASVMTGEYDALLVDEDQSEYIVDFKHLGWYGYIKLAVLGLPEGNPNYYTQLQLYLLGQPQAKGAILHVGVQDYNSANKLWHQGQHQFGKQKDDLPQFVVLYIEPDAAEQYDAKARAEEVKFLIENVDRADMVLREYDPRRDRFPCQYCAWQKRCIDVG